MEDLEAFSATICGTLQNVRNDYIGNYVREQEKPTTDEMITICRYMHTELAVTSAILRALLANRTPFQAAAAGAAALVTAMETHGK
jgi:hypothetical protein